MVTFFSNFMISGNARGATADSIQLGLDASDQDGNYIDWLVSITDGCGSGQTRRISGYDALTKTLVISKPWQCDPDLTSTYVLYVDPWLNPISIFEHINSQHVPLEAPSLTRSDREQSNSKCLRQGVTKARVRTEEEEEHTEIRKYVSIVESLSGSATSCDGRRRQCRSDFAERHFTLPGPSYRPPSPPRTAEVFSSERHRAASLLGQAQEFDRDTADSYHGRTEETYHEAIDFLEVATAVARPDGRVPLPTNNSDDANAPEVRTLLV
jgi:hypothetical protein